MERIKKWLDSGKNFKQGVKLLLDLDSTLSATYRNYFEQQVEKEKPDTIAVQLLESRLRNLLRIAGQKKREEAKSESLTEGTKPEEPTEDEQKEPEDEPEEQEEPETEPEEPEEPETEPEQPKTKKRKK